MDILEIGPVVQGEILSKTGGGFFEVVNPATGEVIAHEACCDSADLDRIVSSSQKAFDSAGWQKMTPADRGNILLKLADHVEQKSDELIELELLDTGKPISQLREMEIPLSAAIIRFYAGAADKIEGSVKSTSGGGFHLTMYEPYGVVAGILPWNYPLVNVAMKVAPALAAGNAIVVKPSVKTPLSCVKFAGLCTEAGLPPGIVNVALGPGSSAGNALVAHPEVKKISFTGSTSVGQAIQKQAVERMKMVNLELGGKNAIIVFEDADLERAAQAVLFSAFVNAGQLCVACSRLLVQEPIAREFESLLKEKLEKVRTGDPRSEDTLVGPMITRSQYEIALDYLLGARKEGCKILSGGGKLELPAPHDKGFWIQSTLLSGVQPGMKVADQEIFGPVLSSIRFKDEAEAVNISNGVIYGLSGSVWTRDGARAMRMVKALDTGLVWVNCMLAGYPQIPLPPHKMSGTGVELGIEGLLAYCKRKSAVLGYDDNAPVGWDIK
ncbi:MAG TPA: aldehyde dehydrogenase family protein [archaeon]|nr:aldehyde dehydrogenase family protein [archaeon]